eukprot:scaffold420574_cov38-Prasinocladus_malaysianus.AAC.1
MPLPNVESTGTVSQYTAYYEYEYDFQIFGREQVGTLLPAVRYRTVALCQNRGISRQKKGGRNGAMAKARLSSMALHFKLRSRVLTTDY